MSDLNDVLVVLCTAPDDDTANRIADVLVESRVAACVTILPVVRSVYRWQGAVERSTEVQLLIKTTRARCAVLIETIATAHPHDVPEIIALPVADGLPAYLRWVVEETSP